MTNTVPEISMCLVTPSTVSRRKTNNPWKHKFNILHIRLPCNCQQK